MDGQFGDERRTNHRPAPSERPAWHGTPGPAKGARWPIEKFLTEGYQALAWMDEYHQPPKKVIFCKRLLLARPTLNEYLKGGGIPWPFPPPEHLVYVVDGYNFTLRWVNDSVCQALGRAYADLVGSDAIDSLRRGEAIEPDHVRYAKQLQDGQIDEAPPIDTHMVLKGGLWLPVRLCVSYGHLYEAWFADAEAVGEPFVPRTPLEQAIAEADGIFNVAVRRNHGEILRKMYDMVERSEI